MNFAAIVTALSLIKQVLPSVEQLVQQAEAIIGTGNGSTKLAYVENAVNTVLAKATSDVEVLSSLQTLLAPTISLIVTAFNLKGTFTSTSAAAAPAPAPAA